MINILVVEDEPPIQRMICKTITGLDREFNIAFTAFNGAEARKILETESIDVVFTDIMMIGGDGITLLQYLHEEKPEIQTVVLSGYDKFEYARQAYKNGVADYLLKPINKAELQSVLKVLRERHQLKLQSKRRACFKALLAGEDCGREQPFCGMAAGTRWNLLLIRVSGGRSELGGLEQGRRNPALSDEQVEAAVMEQLGTEDTMFLPADGAGEYILAIREEAALVEEGALRLLDSMKGRHGAVTAIAKTEKAVEAKGFRQNFLELRIQIMTESVYGKSCYSCNGYSWPPHDDTWEKDVKSEAFLKMVKDLKAGDLEEVRRGLDCFLEKFRQENKTCMAIENIMMELLERGRGSSHSMRAGVWNAVYETFSYRELRSRLFGILSGLETRQEGQDEEETLPRMVTMIEQYLLDNYQRNIKAGELSTEFGFVSEYISRIFKKYVGLSPSRYLTKIRMEKACELIRSCPGIQIKEVADQVGYKDIHYFSKVFRKEMGVWPSEYK